MTSKLYAIKNFKASESLLRMAADFVLIHLSMLAALATTLGLEALVGTPRANETIGQALGYYASYYTTQFIPLSLFFPITFFLHGFYTQSRRYTSRYKLLVTAQGVLIGCLIFLAANYLLFRSDLIPRRAGLLFAAFALTSVPFVRFAKSSFLRYFHVSPRTSAPSSRGTPECVLVVGGAGYIGSILVRRLLDQGRHVRVLDSLVYGDAAIRDLVNHPRFELVVGDCRNIQSVVGAVLGVDRIVHLAAIVGDPACEQDRQSALQINYAATRMMIEVAKGDGVRQFIFASSCSVYGATECLADEKVQVNPISLYAQTKVDSEKALLNAASSSFSPVVLRFATVFGHSWRPRFDLVVNLLTAKAYRESVVTIYNGQQWRPFIHVRDICNAIIKVIDAPVEATAGQIYNVGDSRLNYTLTQVADHISLHFPDLRVEHVDNADKRNYRVSFEKIRQELGFECAIGLDDGIAEMHDAFRLGIVSDYKDVRYHNQRFLQISGALAPPQELDGDIMAAFARTELAARAAAS